MPQVQLQEHIFEAARERAARAGYANVDEYVSDLILAESDADEAVTPNLDHLFTPERLAHIDQAAEEVRSGKFHTSEQSAAELANRRAEWIRDIRG